MKTPPAHHNPVRRRTWKTRLLVALVLLALVLVGSEIFARLGLGLGDPPLMMTDPEIEYLAQPSKSYTRFGNRIAYNQWSMRSDEFPARKTQPDELRVMVLGDSVVNGGAQSDQANIATEIIRRSLTDSLGSRVVVGNIAAGSWGPANLLAYVKRFGLFEADVVVIVTSSHDAMDVPTFEPLGLDMPQRKPVLALQEATQRYLPRYLPGWMGGRKSLAGEVSQPVDEATRQANQAAALAALRELLAVSKQSGARVLLVQHWEQSELKNGPQSGHEAIAQLAAEAGVSRIDLGPAFADASKRGETVYRDYIHPNDAGQRIIAQSILEWIQQQ